MEYVNLVSGHGQLSNFLHNFPFAFLSWLYNPSFAIRAGEN